MTPHAMEDGRTSWYFAQMIDIDTYYPFEENILIVIQICSYKLIITFAPTEHHLFKKPYIFYIIICVKLWNRCILSQIFYLKMAKNAKKIIIYYLHNDRFEMKNQ